MISQGETLNRSPASSWIDVSPVVYHVMPEAQSDFAKEGQTIPRDVGALLHRHAGGSAEDADGPCAAVLALAGWRGMQPCFLVMLGFARVFPTA